MTAATEAAEFHPARHPYRWVMLFGVWLLYLCFGLTVASMAPLVGPIGTELGLSHSAMGGVMGAWPLVYIASAVPCGAILDRIGPRQALFVAALIIALSTALRAFADGHLSLFLAVAVFGHGGPMLSVGSPKLIALRFEGSQRGLAMGIYHTGVSLGGIAALALTHAVMMPLMDGNWRMVLLVYAGLVCVSAVVWLVVNLHWASRALEARIAAESRPPHLQVFADLIRLPVVRGLLLLGICIFFFNHSLNNWLPEILRAKGMDAVAAGYWSSIPTVVGIFGALTIPRLAVPERRLAILFGLIVAAAGASLLIQAGAGFGPAAGLMLQGIARDALTTIALLVLMEARDVGPRAMGSAGGMYFSAGEVGGVMGPLTVGYVSDTTGGFSAALYMLTGVCAVMLLALARLRPMIRRL